MARRRRRRNWTRGEIPAGWADKDSTAPDLALVEEPEPWQEPDRAELVEDVADFIHDYVVNSPEQLDLLAVFVAHTYAISAAECTPYLAVMSKGPRAGKTRLLEVLEQLVRNPIRTADITEAALFHLISDPNHPVTLLLDEIDTVFSGGRTKEGLRALLNASYRRGSAVRRVKGNRVITFDAFGAKVIAGIGELPATVADRSIPVTMTRKPGKVQVKRFLLRRVNEESLPLRERLTAAFTPHEHTLGWLQELADYRPELPDYLNDRLQDSWEPLFSLAHLVGGDWTERLTAASKALTDDGDTESSWEAKIRRKGDDK